MTFFALPRHRPMVRMYSPTSSSPSASIFSGVSAAANSARVALLTPASVACADSTTATSSVKALTCSSSPFGSGRCTAEATEDLVHLGGACRANSGRAGRGRRLAFEPSRRRGVRSILALGLFHRPSIIAAMSETNASAADEPFFQRAADAAPVAWPHGLYGADGRAAVRLAGDRRRSSCRAAPGRSSASSASTCSLVYVAFRAQLPRGPRPRGSVGVAHQPRHPQDGAVRPLGRRITSTRSGRAFSVARHDEIGITGMTVEAQGQDRCRSAASSIPTTGRALPRHSRRALATAKRG